MFRRIWRGVVDDVEGLDTRPIGRPRRLRTRYQPAALANAGVFTNRWPGTFLPPEIAALYAYPSEFEGAGINLAIFAFNGGNAPDPRGGYSLAALKTYFEQVLGGKTPTIKDVVVRGPGNDPGPDTQQSSSQGDATGEVMLDLCVAGSVAPGANLFVYFTEFSGQGWAEALHEAITDSNDIAVISISYGNPENDPRSAWTTAGIKLVNDALAAARSKGITICCASGDDGSSNQGSNGAHADFPASSPWVLEVGGTSLKSTGGVHPQIASETVWNDMSQPQPEGAGGGGVSAIFTLPSYQDAAGVPPSANPPHRSSGAASPMSAAVADPETGVVVMHVDGKSLEPIGGTSAAAPLWASLIVRINQGLELARRLLEPDALRQLRFRAFSTTSLPATTVPYKAGVGWDACTGLGSPNGEKLLNALKKAPAPQA